MVNGFHVVCTFEPHDTRTQTQIRGRAGRAGQRGSYREILQRGEARASGPDFRQINRNVIESLKTDLFSGYYQIFDIVLENPASKGLTLDQQHLILWMSQKSTRENILKAIEAKLQTNDNAAIEGQLGTFFTKFRTPSRFQPTIRETFFWRTDLWYGEWAATLAALTA